MSVTHKGGGKLMSVTVFGQPSITGLGQAGSVFKEPAQLLMYSAFLTSCTICLMFKRSDVSPHCWMAVWVPYMGCSGIIGVGLSHCYLVFCGAVCQLPSCLSDIYWATLMRNLVNHLLPFFRSCWGLDMSQEVPQVLLRIWTVKYWVGGRSFGSSHCIICSLLSILLNKTEGRSRWHYTSEALQAGSLNTARPRIETMLGCPKTVTDTNFPPCVTDMMNIINWH